MTTLPPITNKQATIISLVFRFRFLDRTHIQRFLKHKDYKTINDWLRDLTHKAYLTRLYTTTFPENTKPAVYHIATNGISFLKAHNKVDPKFLHKLYRETDRTTGFINRCLLLATIYLDLLRTTDKINFTMHVASDYPTHPFEALLTELSPHAYIEQKRLRKIKRYFMEILADLPSLRLRQRIRKYLSLFQSSEWEGATGTPFPTMLIVCGDENVLAYVRRYIKTKLALLDEPTLAIHLTTVAKVKECGVTGDIWEGVK